MLAILAVAVGVYTSDLYPESNAIGGFVVAGLLLLWAAYTKVLHIIRKQGETIDIPSHSKKNVDTLLHLFQK